MIPLQSFAYNGCYASLFGGIQNLYDDDLRFPGGVFATEGWDWGWDLGLAYGFAMDSGWRVEAEASYHKNKASWVSSGGAWAATNGSASTWNLMANLYYDFHIPCAELIPYVGGGAGPMRVRMNNNFPGAFAFDDSTWVFGYQLIGGVAYPYCPNIDLFLELRYIGCSEPNFGSSIGSVDAEYEATALNLGIMYGF